MKSSATGHHVMTGYEAKLERESGQAYRGRPIFAPPGLHEFLAEQAVQWFPDGCRLLDLGAGGGALALRLSDCGFEVECADAMPSDALQELGLRTYRADFNQRFAADLGDPYEAIVSSEVIEHLENPRQFLREIHAALAPGGSAILTTPNLCSVTSKTRFVRYGCFDWFTEPDRAGLGHISPIFPWSLAESARAAGLEVKQMQGFGSKTWGLEGWPSQRMLAALVRRVTNRSGDPDGNTLVAVLGRPAAMGAQRPDSA